MTAESGEAVGCRRADCARSWWGPQSCAGSADCARSWQGLCTGHMRPCRPCLQLVGGTRPCSAVHGSGSELVALCACHTNFLPAAPAAQASRWLRRGASLRAGEPFALCVSPLLITDGGELGGIALIKHASHQAARCSRGLERSGASAIGLPAQQERQAGSLCGSTHCLSIRCCRSIASIEWFAEEAKRTCGDIVESPDRHRRFMVRRFA